VSHNSYSWECKRVREWTFTLHFGSWSPNGLLNFQKEIARVKTHWIKTFLISLETLLEICHFATILCNWFSVACDTCNYKFAQLRKTSCIKIVVASDSPYMTSIYGWVIWFHPPIFYTNNCKCDCMQLQGLRSHCITC
jgi:hypothetical protein